MADTLVSEKIGLREKITIEIDGKWKARNVIDFFSSIQNLYDYYSCFLILSDFKEYSKSEKEKWYEDQIICIGHINQTFVGKSTTFIDRKNKFYFFDKDMDDSHDLKLALIEPLFLKKFSYASPGFKDLIGAGEVIGHLKDFCFKIIDIFITKNKRKNEDRKEKLENEILEIERNRQFAKLLEEVGFEKEEIKKVILSEYKNALPIVKLIQEGKITGIK
ncbi:hypothetical protein [Pseudozobellia thermophila]|uniref:Uncharacterized protein n=1 Tax=Pseudozobellia thermophila TaxID=192903 RepID=A0A1M6G5H1_9FLAO|nr:hypothetical protein [Pseudozobellia thermophila]SHJ05258.1 hypothetical protein SAMN04488513_102688 [Pseudozobellia thermophila]